MRDRVFYRTEFVVEGRCTFPLDMLRWDQCYPTDGVVNIFHTLTGEGEMVCSVKLVAPLTERESPTVERWRSFGWSVDPDSIQSTMLVVRDNG